MRPRVASCSSRSAHAELLLLSLSVHDYFDILGVPRNAAPPEIRRACCRRSRSSHPDIWDGDVPALSATGPGKFPSFPRSMDDLSDTAIDFVDMTQIVDRILDGFFAGRHRT